MACETPQPCLCCGAANVDDSYGRGSIGCSEAEGVAACVAGLRTWTVATVVGIRQAAAVRFRFVNYPPVVPMQVPHEGSPPQRGTSLQGFTWSEEGEEGEGAARGGQQEASLCIIPPFHSLQHGGQRGDDTAGGTDGVDSWGEEGEGAARGGQQEASLCIIPPFHSLQHGGQRGDDTAAGTDGVDSWGEEGEGAARGGQQEASLCIIPPFHSLQHGGQRGDDTAAGTDGGEVLLHRCSEHGGQRGDDTAGGTDGGSKTQDRLRLRHRCCAAGVADGVGTDASRA
ncbi:unnamed protein product [Closterium sp. Naga37s-1]|nr:unnamed protein product [Closterium sp. Naga37s-1]